MQEATDAAHLEGNADLVGGHDFRQSQPYKGEGSLEVENHSLGYTAPNKRSPSHEH